MTANDDAPLMDDEQRLLWQLDAALARFGSRFVYLFFYSNFPI